MKKGGHMPVASPTEILCVLFTRWCGADGSEEAVLDRDNIPRFS